MTIKAETLNNEQTALILKVPEGQFSEIKGLDASPANLTKAISAFANTDGGDLFIGIEEQGYPAIRKWNGFANMEDANGHLQIFEKLFPLGTDFQYEFLRANHMPGFLLHVQINKTAGQIYCLTCLRGSRYDAAVFDFASGARCLKKLLQKANIWSEMQAERLMSCHTQKNFF